MASATRRISSLTQLQQCQNISELLITRPCLCHYEVCVGWYPCGLKYCKDKDSANKVTSYRCGIKTCSKCRMFEFYVPQRDQCAWDMTENFPNIVDNVNHEDMLVTMSQDSHREL